MCSKKFLQYKNLKVIGNIFYIVILLIGILGIAQNYYIHYNSDLLPVFNKGICGTFNNSNFMGTFLSITLPITMILFIINGKKKNLILSGILFFNMLACLARSSWVAFFATFLIILIYLIKKRNKEFVKKALILLGIFIIIFTYMFYFKNARFSNKFKTMVGEIKSASQSGIEDNMGSNRIKIWKLAVELISKKPILGSGPDTFAYGLARNCTEGFIEYYKASKGILDKAHNEYLHITATMGIPAVCIYLTFIGFILIPKLKFMYKDKAHFIICTCIISYLIQAFFNISIIYIAPLFWILLGIIDNTKIIDEINELK